MFTEIIGYVGMILVVVSLLINNTKNFRILNLIGAFLSFAFALLKGGMIPIVIMNLAIVIIDIYYLVQILTSEKINK
jgi:hypothetical protein